MMSRFVIALLFFLNLGFLTAKFVESVKDNSDLVNGQERTWTEWALADFSQKKNNPAQIVIIGSSLVLTPINLADAHFHSRTIDGAVHHKSDLLISLMGKVSNDTVENFSFALPGLMPSDAYLVTKLLLTSKNYPKLLIYGVGPRDFVDNLLASSASTDPYRCLSKYLSSEDKEKANTLYRAKDWQSYLDHFLAEHFSIYGQRNEILSLCAKQSRNLIRTIEVAKNESKVANIHYLLPSYNPMSIGMNQCLFQPEVKLDPDRFNNNINEYRARYRKVNWDTFTCQSNCFVNLLKLARDNDINVVVVAMPVTSVNKELLPDYIFALYKNNLRVLSKSFGAYFLDLDDTNCFNDEDFGDTVHLSTSGSTKMIKLIFDYIVGHNFLKTSTSQQRRLADTGVKI